VARTAPADAEAQATTEETGSMTKVCGIDPSLSATGLAGPDGELSTVHTETDDPNRLAKIYTGVVLVAGGCDLAVMEDLPKHAHGAGLTGMAQGVVRLALIHCGVPYVTVVASSLKKYATGNGGASKPDMRMALFRRAELDVRDDNQVDAWWAWQIALWAAGDERWMQLPKTHLLTLDKIKNWPDGFPRR
jgi:Holliday junction resolvasome RuvABC endonuclease subunit